MTRPSQLHTYLHTYIHTYLPTYLPTYLQYNLDDMANLQLMERVLNGDLAMETLCRMSPTELASRDVQVGR